MLEDFVTSNKHVLGGFAKMTRRDNLNLIVQLKHLLSWHEKAAVFTHNVVQISMSWLQ